MDCRRTLLVALGLTTGVVGCTHGPSQSLVNVPVGAEIQNEPAKAPRKPQAATSVALAELREMAADEPGRSALEKQQLRDQARKAYQQALETDPTNLAAERGLARLYVKMEDHTHAVSTYRRLLADHPKDAAMWYELGMYHGSKKEWDASLEALNSAHKCDPENRLYANTLGYCLARCGRFDESLACFRKVTSEGKAHYNLARMLHHLKADDLSKQHLQLALQAEPQLAAAGELLAQLEGRAPAGSKSTRDLELVGATSPSASN